MFFGPRSISTKPKMSPRWSQGFVEALVCVKTGNWQQLVAMLMGNIRVKASHVFFLVFACFPSNQFEQFQKQQLVDSYRGWYYQICIYIYILYVYYILYILYYIYNIYIYIYTRKPCVSPLLKLSYVTFEICISFRRNTFVAIVTPKKCILTCGHQWIWARAFCVAGAVFLRWW